MDIKFPKNSQTPQKFYECEICDIKTNNKKDYKNHIITPKHLLNVERYTKISTYPQNNSCECGNKYKHYSGLWRHKKLCTSKLNYAVNENGVVQEDNKTADDNSHENQEEKIVRDASSNEIKILTSLIFQIFKSNNELQQQNMEMQKQNQEFQKQMMEVVCKNIQQPINNNTANNINTTNNNNTINANKTFNLNFFLNEQCKNAMNLKDFVDSMEVTLEDAEKIGDEGYVEGMSSLLIRKINETDIFLRPIHCSDSKRDITHIKRNDKWERDGNNEQLTMAIKYIEQKNMVALDQFGEKYPNWRDSDSPHNDKYLNMMIKLTDSGTEEYKKVAKRIIKAVIIDKENV